VSSLLVSLGVFAAIMVAVLAGLLLRAALPAHHTSDASKDVIKIGMGLVVTLSAMVLGLLVASAKSTYNTKAEEIDESATRVILLDHSLRQYGEETKPIRELLRNVIASKVALKWVEEEGEIEQGRPAATRNIDEAQRMIGSLSPANEVQRAAQSEALQILSNLAHTRWLLVTQKGSSIPLPFLVVLVFWFVVIFGSMSLLAPRNGTVYAVIVVCALSVSSAIFLIMELDTPFEGLLQISDAPLQSAINQLKE
jgi:hypothetical protein